MILLPLNGGDVDYVLVVLIHEAARVVDPGQKKADGNLWKRKSEGVVMVVPLTKVGVGLGKLESGGNSV